MRILTFDVEDWFHILDNASTRTDQQWRQYPSRLDANIDRLLDILQRYGCPATFFCLGWVAEQHPNVIKRIAAAGYEIGSHSYAHQLAYEQTPEAFATDLSRSLAVLEDLLGTKVRSYRAPGFSLKPDNVWVFDILIEHGIEIDCSIFPAARGHGGFPHFGAAEPVVVVRPGGSIKEFPINVASVFGRDLVFSGGGYFRLFPYPLVRRLADGSPYLMTYFHPRDFDPDQPRLPGLSFARRFRSYYGLREAAAKLEKLLEEFRFVDLGAADAEVDWTSCRRLALQ